MQAIARGRGRSAAAPTAARSATSRPTTSEVAITIRSVVLRDGTAFVHAGAGIVADSVPATRIGGGGRQGGRRAGGAGPGRGDDGGCGRGRDRGMSADGRDRGARGAHDRGRSAHRARRQLRLVHLQPVPVPADARRRGRGRAQRRDHRRCHRGRWTPTASSSRPGPSRPENAGISRRAHPRARAHGADAGRLPRPPGDGPGLRRRRHPRRAGPRQALGRVARRAGRLRGPPLPARGRPLPLAGHRRATRCPTCSR